MRTLLVIVLSCFPMLTWGAAYTSTQNGNWSDTATWGGSGPPGSGDTATLAHNVAVDVNTSIGTSPNDTTTAVITLNASKILTLNAGVTLTVLGNISWNTSASGVTLSAGSNLVFDNSASGGSPVYKFIGTQVNVLTGNGTSNSPCGISAIAGQTWSINSSNFSAVSCTYTVFTRLAASQITTFSGSSAYSRCTWDGCGEINFRSTGTTTSLTVSDCTWTNSTGNNTTVGSAKLEWTGAFTSGTRVFTRNVLDKFLSHVATGFTITTNCFLSGLTCTAGRAWGAFRNNFVKQAGNLNGGDGQLFTASCYRNYFVVDPGEPGNPHFLGPTALLSADNTISQCIFESQSDDLVDVGDSILIKGVAASGGFKIIAKNCLVLPTGFVGDTVSSGTLVTLFATTVTPLFEAYRNTVNVNNTSVGGVGVRGAIAFAEGGTGAADQVSAMKSNLAWGSSALQGYLGERVSGNIKDIITAANANYNWRYNSSVGDNLRGYEDRAAANTLWTAGDAAAASVDDDQGSGDPQFYDSSRNIAAWATARGYGSTYANGLTAIQADPTRTADLIAFVFEGFRPGNASCRNAAADGACVGAANFYKSSRRFGAVNSYRSTLSIFGL